MIAGMAVKIPHISVRHPHAKDHIARLDVFSAPMFEPGTTGMPGRVPGMAGPAVPANGLWLSGTQAAWPCHQTESCGEMAPEAS